MERLAIILVVIVVTAVLSWVVSYFKNRMDIANLPSGEQRLKLLQELRIKRSQGQSYGECLKYLKDKGYRSGVAEGLLVDLESEVPPDLEQTHIMKWNQWTCEYPGNWKAIVGYEDLPEELAICLESPGGSSIVFFEHPELSAETFLSEQRANLSQVLATDIRVWGSLEGYGEVLKGTQLEFKVPMELTVFECTTPHKLILVQTMLTEEQNHVNPGFDLIESSFKPLTIPS